MNIEDIKGLDAQTTQIVLTNVQSTIDNLEQQVRQLNAQIANLRRMEKMITESNQK